LIRAIGVQARDLIADWAERHPNDTRIIAELNGLDRVRQDRVRLDMEFHGWGA